MKLFLRCLLAFGVFLAILLGGFTILLLIIAFADHIYVSEALVGMITNVLLIGGIVISYWLVFGRQRLKKYHERKERAIKALEMMRVPPPDISDSAHSQSADECPLFYIHTPHTAKDAHSARIFCTNTSLQSWVESGGRRNFIYIGIFAAFVIFGFIFGRDVIDLHAMRWFAAPILLGILLIFTPSIVYKINGGKNFSPGTVTCSFYSSYLFYQIFDERAKTEVSIPYLDIKKIYRYKNSFYILTKGKMWYFIPPGDSYEPEQLEAFLAARFPSNMHIAK